MSLVSYLIIFRLGLNWSVRVTMKRYFYTLYFLYISENITIVSLENVINVDKTSKYYYTIKKQNTYFHREYFVKHIKNMFIFFIFIFFLQCKY